MKRASLLGLCLALNVMCAPVALAEPVELTGEAALKYERDRSAGSPAVNGRVFSFTLNATAKLSDKISLYGRLGAQSTSNTLIKDFDDAYGADKKAVIGLDQFGLTWEQDELVYKLGRQDLTIGSTALLYSRPATNIGKRAFVDGLAVNGTVGDTDVAFFAGQEDSAGSVDNRLIALRASYSPNDTWTYGATVGRYVNKGAGETTNHWALDGTYKFGKNSLTVETTRASSSQNNKAHIVKWDYGFNDKLSAFVAAFRVEENGSMGGNSDFDSDNRGLHYSATYKFDDNLSLETIFKNQKKLTTGERNNSLELTLHYAF